MDTKKVKDLADRHMAEHARRANARAEEEVERRQNQASMEQMVTEPWDALGQELREFEKDYNARFGKQVIYVEIHPDKITVRAEVNTVQWLTIQLNRQTGNVNGTIGHEPLELRMVAAIGEYKQVWMFEQTSPADPADIALALGKKLTALSGGILRDEPER